MAEVSRTMSRKEWRKFIKKFRRKRIRQKLAQDRDRAEAESEAQKLADPNYVAYLREAEQLEQEILQRQEDRSRYENALWLDRERQAQASFEEKRKRLEEEQREETEKREKIRKEFAELERKAKEAKKEKEQLMEKFRQQQQERERMFAEYLVGIDDHALMLREIVHSRPDRDACVFFGKVGACRYGARCSSDHPTPGLSELLLMPNFFAHPALDHQQHPEYGLDSSIEFDDDELYRCYTEFFLDIVEEFESFGVINGIFVCRNYELHLRGNVYVQYTNMRDAAKAYQRMNGRFYASKQLRVEFRSPIVWTSAVCGKLNEMWLFERSRCQKGKSCNYLHLLVNPMAKYRYNHFKELQSARQSQRQSQRSQLLERSWDDIEIPTKQRTNWRWSETPDVELPLRSSRSSSRSETTRRHRDRAERSRSRSSRRSRSSSKRSRNRSRSRSRNRSRERRKEKRRKVVDSRSRSSDRRKGKDRKRRSHSSESRKSDKGRKAERTSSRKLAK